MACVGEASSTWLRVHFAGRGCRVSASEITGADSSRLAGPAPGSGRDAFMVSVSTAYRLGHLHDATGGVHASGVPLRVPASMSVGAREHCQSPWQRRLRLYIKVPERLFQVDGCRTALLADALGF